MAQPAEVQGRVDVGVHHKRKVLVVALEDLLAGVDAHVVHQDVQPPCSGLAMRPNRQLESASQYRKAGAPSVRQTPATLPEPHDEHHTRAVRGP